MGEVNVSDVTNWAARPERSIMMRELSTLTGHRFRFKTHPDGEYIVYTPDDEGKPQGKSAIVITPFTVDLVKKTIKETGRIAMGASRDKPPRGSLGALLRAEKQSPQQLSYLIPILMDQGYCDYAMSGRSFIIKHVDKSG